MKEDFLLYLYNLALITIAFVGFAALYLGFKQQMAGKMTKFDVMLTENHFLLSFMVVGAALLPPLFALVPSEQLSWETALRITSFYNALQLFLFCITFPGRRSRASEGELMPTGTKVLVAFYYLVVGLMLISLIVNKPALYAFVLTGQQIINVITFMYALGSHVLHVPAGSATLRRRVHHSGQTG
jgi:hypothetical protein